MKTKLFSLKEIFPLIIILAMVLVSIGFYSAACLPDRIPSHWNAAGEIDGYSSKAFTLIFYPALALGMYLLMIFLPLLDPLRKNYIKFKTPYYFIRLVLVAFFALLFFFSLAAGYGYQWNIKNLMIPAISLMIIAFGFILPKIEKNWFVGIRTPWTLGSDKVWQDTHKFGGKTFMLAGLLSFFTIFLPSELAFGLFLAIILVGTLSPVLYSYIVYRKLGLFKNK